MVYTMLKSNNGERIGGRGVKKRGGRAREEIGERRRREGGEGAGETGRVERGRGRGLETVEHLDSPLGDELTLYVGAPLGLWLP